MADQREVDEEFIADVTRRIAHRLPAMGRATLVKGWASLYDIDAPVR